MKKKITMMSVVASLLMASASVSADYYQYVDELRKPGQSVEEAKQEQESAYKKRMQEKYANVPSPNNKVAPLTKQERAKIKAQHKKIERQILAQRLDLTDSQKSKLEGIHGQMESFMQEKRAEILFYKAVKEKEFMDVLTDSQKEKFKALRSAKDFHAQKGSKN